MNNNKTTLIIGASEKPERYAYKALKLLVYKGYAVKALALKKGKVDMVNFETDATLFENGAIHTVTMYIGRAHQQQYIPFILKLKPQRVIFNPGTENEDFYSELDKHYIAYEEACTLILLNTGQY
jgi:predicted CoA-binding protein